jgi:hypothetical protein
VLLASLFTFFSLFAVIGSLMAALPDSVFRRISIYLRVLIVILLLALLCTTFAVPPMLHTLSHDPHSPLRWFPPVWFLGLSRTMLGKANAALAQMGATGVRAIFAVTLLAPMVYVLSYYRYFIRIPETLDTTLRNRAPRHLFPMRLMDRLILRSGFERAIHRFAMKTLLRNERQSLLFGAFAGLGFVIASQTLVSAFNQRPVDADSLPNAALLSAPLVLAYFVICGLRFIFDLPAELNANWVHRVVLDHERHVSAAVTRKIILTFVLPWVLVVCLPLYLYCWGVTVGGALTVVLIAGCYLLTDFLLRRFRKVPFTCAYPAWKQHATVIVLLYVLGLWAFAFLLPGLERALLLRSSWYLWGLAGMLLAARLVMHKLRDDDGSSHSLVFEDTGDSPFELLNLSGH